MDDHATSPHTPSFPVLYREHQHLVRSIIYRIAGKRELDDLVQDAFVRIWKRLHTFEAKSTLKTWIYRIAVNVAIDHCRTHKDDLEYQDEVPHSKQVSTDHGSANRDLVKQIFLMLSPSHRAVLALQAIDGLSIHEIAHALDIPEGTVKSKLYYAKQKSMEFLNKQGVTP